MCKFIESSETLTPTLGQLETDLYAPFYTYTLATKTLENCAHVLDIQTCVLETFLQKALKAAACIVLFPRIFQNNGLLVEHTSRMRQSKIYFHTLLEQELNLAVWLPAKQSDRKCLPDTATEKNILTLLGWGVGREVCWRPWVPRHITDNCPHLSECLEISRWFITSSTTLGATHPIMIKVTVKVTEQINKKNGPAEKKNGSEA